MTPLIEAAWLAVLALTPVVVDLWSDQPGDPSKAVILRFLTLLMLGGWLVSPALRRSWQLRLLGTIVACWLAAHVVSTMTSIATAVSLFGGNGRGQELVTIASYAVLLLLVAGGLTSRARRDRAVSVILVASTSVAIHALVQRAGLDGTAPPVLRPGATLGGPTFLAAYLAMTAPLALARLLENARLDPPRPAGIAVHAVVFVLQAAALLSTLSRGPFLGFAAAMLGFVLLDARISGARQAVAWGLPCLVAILATVSAGGGFARLVAPGGDTTRVRVLVWEATMRLAGPHEPLWSPVVGEDRLNRLRPVIGYGPESLYAALGPFRQDELARLESGAKPDRAHNALLDALATTGALGALGYLALVTAVLAGGLERLHIVTRGDLPRLIAWCATGSVGAAVVATAVLGTPWIAPAVGWGLVAGSLAFVALDRRSRAAGDVVSAALVAGVIGHVVETQVGIATTTSWVHFAFFAGALAAEAGAETTDGADGIAVQGIMAGLVLCALVFQLLGAERWGGPGPIVLLGGTTVGALLLVSATHGRSPRDAVWFAALAIALPVAFALPERLLVQRAATGSAAAPVYAVLLFLGFVTIAVLLAARAIRGERLRAARPRLVDVAASTFVLLAAVLEIARLQGDVLAWVATRGPHPVEERIVLLDRACRLQPLVSRADTLLGLAYLSLAERGHPEYALARAEDALSNAGRSDPFNADHTIDLARLARAAARLLPAESARRLATATARYDEAARLDPAARNVHLERAATLADQARVLEHAGDEQAAASVLERARAARERARMLQPASAYSAAMD